MSIRMPLLLMILMYMHLIHPEHISNTLMFNDQDLDERYPI